ncbi:MAG: YbjQ family protein [Vicinamibacteria bacterium]
MRQDMTTTTFDIPGYRVVRSLGVVRGLTVRSRSILGSFVGGLQTIMGGNITIYAELCEKAREDAFQLMKDHAATTGANAIIGVRFDANEIMDGVTEVLCYGTAVKVEAAAVT